MTISYLHNENHLIVYPAVKELMENDLFFTYIGVRAHYGMSGQELLQSCLQAWNLVQEKEYRLVLIREDQEIDVELDKNIKDFGLRNGDPLQIIAM